MEAAYQELLQIKQRLQENVARLLAAKEAQDGSDTVRRVVTESAVMLLELRQLNRSILRNEEEVKLHTEAAKAPVDSTKLRLNNLLYEKNHYVKAVKACNDFKSKYPNLDIVSEAEFFRDAPDNLKAEVAEDSSPHKLVVQRLNCELHQRKELLKRKEELEMRKRTLQESVNLRKRFLATLPDHLKALKQATVPIEQQLGLHPMISSEQRNLADL